MNTQIEDKEELEYNDGLGDLLREKERLEFSWTKTIFTLVIVVAILFMGLTFVFNIGKRVISPTNQSSVTPTISISEIETENEALVSEVVSDIPEEAPPALIKPSAPSPAPVVTKKAVTKPVKKAKVAQKTKKKAIQTVKQPLAYKLIAGSFLNPNNASQLKKTLKGKGIDAYIWTSTRNDGQTLYKVQVGAFPSKVEANKAKARYQTQGVDSFIFVKS